MYNKLFSKILDSSIWLEDHPTRIVWITLLAAMDQDGFAPFSTVQNLARRAGVTDEEAEAAVAVLEGPDRWKQAENDPGNRIERVPGGYFVIKAAEYAAIVRREEMRAAVRERVRRHREAKSGCNAPVTQSDVDQTVPDVDQAQMPPRPSARTAPTLVSMAEHRNHAACGRVCLPSFLFREFISRKGGDESRARADVGGWANGILAEWGPGGPLENEPIGDDPIKFWRLRFREWQGTTAKPVERSTASVAPTYATAWCQHDPRCATQDVHAIVLAREST